MGGLDVGGQGEGEVVSFHARLLGDGGTRNRREEQELVGDNTELGLGPVGLLRDQGVKPRWWLMFPPNSSVNRSAPESHMEPEEGAEGEELEQR